MAVFVKSHECSNSLNAHKLKEMRLIKGIKLSVFVYSNMGIGFLALTSRHVNSLCSYYSPWVGHFILSIFVFYLSLLLSFFLSGTLSLSPFLFLSFSNVTYVSHFFPCSSAFRLFASVRTSFSSLDISISLFSFLS